MQGDPAQALLELGGHTGTVPGAVLAADLPTFAQRLRDGLLLAGDRPSPAVPVTASGPSEPRDPDDDGPRERPISLRLRAVPLLDMIDTAIRQQSDLMWDRA
jgi:hypothetical protein